MSKEKNAEKKKENEDLKKLVTVINKKFGENAIGLGCPKDIDGNTKTLKRLSTGSFSLDLDLGNGIPLGRFIEISGHLSSTKTTQSLHIIRNAQKMGLRCAFIDVENTTDDKYLRQLGVIPEDLIYTNPDGTEEATEVILELQRSKLVDLVVLDSIASMKPTKVIESSMGEPVQMGIQQKLLDEFLGKYTACNNRLEREYHNPFTIIGLNQLREKMGGYGNWLVA